MSAGAAPVPTVIRATLRPRVGHRVFRYRTVGSTQDVALALAQRGVEEGAAVLADEQTAARGRFGRAWVAPPGASVSLSVVLYPTPEVLQRLGIAAAVAVARAIRRITSLQPTVKWPNDVRLSGRKVCGILVESRVPEAGTATAILGIGLNVDLPQAGRYPELAGTATGLVQEVGRQVSVAEVAEAVLDELDGVYGPQALEPALHHEWRGLLDTLGRQVEVRWRDTVETGVAEDADAAGNLVVRRPDGSRVTLLAGEVTFQR